MNYKEMLNKLPGNWQELKLKDYIKLTPVIVEPEDVFIDEMVFTNQYISEIEKNVKVISLLLDIAVEEVEAITMVQLNELINKIGFINIAPVPVKSSIKFKKFNELTYDNFITYHKIQLNFSGDYVLGNAVSNLPLMLSMFSADNLSEDYFLNLSMPEVIAGFFIVTKNIKKYLKRLEVSSYKEMMKLQLQTGKMLITSYWQNRKTLKRSLTKTGHTG